MAAGRTRSLGWKIFLKKTWGKFSHRTSWFLLLDPLFVRSSLTLSFPSYLWHRSGLAKRPLWSTYAYLLGAWQSIVYLFGFFSLLGTATEAFELQPHTVSALIFLLIFLFILPAKNFLVTATATLIYFFVLLGYFHSLASSSSPPQQLLVLALIVLVFRPLWGLAVEFCFFTALKKLMHRPGFRRIVSNLNPTMSTDQLRDWYEISSGMRD